MGLKQPSSQGPSRRSFLRHAATTALLGPALIANRAEAQPAEAGAEDLTILGRVKLDRALYQHDQVLHGTLSFLRVPQGSIQVQWIDYLGRVAGEQTFAAQSTIPAPVDFSFDLRHGLTYMNAIRVKVGGVAQAVGQSFMRAPVPNPWNDYQVITWARYPDGFYDSLRAAGVNATIAYRDSEFSEILNNNFNFYVEQMVWEVYANYHKDLPQWRDTIAKVRADRSNLDLWVRKPCLNDPKTTEYVREQVQRYVRQHRAFSPLYYTISDELGQGDQISANDFCHSEFCAIAFTAYLRKSYGILQNVQAEWSLSEVIRWDDEGIRSGADWERSNLMITRTTTDLAFEAIALANLQQRYDSMRTFNKEWGTTFPEPRGGGMSPRDIWEPVMGLVRESLSVEDLTETALEKALGPLDQLNVRCGNRAGWNAPAKPTSFKSWAEVIAFLHRYDKELAEVQSTKGWNLAPWSDFRNFMDATFADAVLRAATVCKAEDPFARCATEGGQAPFAFGWYNYEQVLRVVDVIEPYNIGNNVEVVRSLKPSAIMLSTVGYDHQPGTPVTAEDRLRQHQAVRPVWWELFHNHQGSIIWDNQEATGTFVDLKTGKLTLPAETFRDVFLELRSGLGMLVMQCARTQASIAVHYSHPSVQAHWLLENVKKARQWMVDTVEAYVTSRFIAVRNSWTKLIEDLQVQYDFVSATQVAQGTLNSGQYRVFVLPESIAVSEAEAEQIRSFVQHGGIVVADFRAALLNEHCRHMDRGQLDELFGIAEGSTRPSGSAIKGEAGEDSLQLAGKDFGRVALGNTAIVTTTGKALAHGGDTPSVVVNHAGDGRAIYLNMDISDYAFERLNPHASPALPELLEGILGLAKIAPAVRVLGSDGKRSPGTEVVVFANGVCELVAIFRNPQLDDGGWGSYATKKSNWRDWTTNVDNAVFETEAEVTIEWLAEGATYDVRARKDLGSIKSCKATLDPWEALVFTRAAGPVPQLGLAVSSNGKAGSLLPVTLTSTGPHPEGTCRVVHLEFDTPVGKVYEAYTQNIPITSFPHTVSLPIAVNDPLGTWRIRGHDLLTGQSLDGSFAVS
jgi:hypothetical protein